MCFVLYMSMEDIDVFCFVYVYGVYRFILFVYVYGGYRCVLFVYIYGGYRCILFCLHLWRISTMYFVLFTFMEDINMYFVLFTFMEDINVICFVYIYGGYRCNFFCLHLWRISM